MAICIVWGKIFVAISTPCVLILRSAKRLANEIKCKQRSPKGHEPDAAMWKALAPTFTTSQLHPGQIFLSALALLQKFRVLLQFARTKGRTAHFLFHWPNSPSISQPTSASVNTKRHGRVLSEEILHIIWLGRNFIFWILRRRLVFLRQRRVHYWLGRRQGDKTEWNIHERRWQLWSDKWPAPHSVFTELQIQLADVRAGQALHSGWQNFCSARNLRERER